MSRDQSPDRSTSLGIESRSQLIEEEHFGIVDHGQRDKKSLFLAPRERHELGVPLAFETESSQERFGVDDLWVQRGPQINGLPDLDPLLELRLLMLDPDSILKRRGVSSRIEAQHRNRSAVRPPQAFHTLHRGGLPRAVRTDQAKDLTLVNLEGYIVHGDGGPVALSQMGDRNDRGRQARLAVSPGPRAVDLSSAQRAGEGPRVPGRVDRPGQVEGAVAAPAGALRPVEVADVRRDPGSGRGPVEVVTLMLPLAPTGQCDDYVVSRACTIRAGLRPAALDIEGPCFVVRCPRSAPSDRKCASVAARAGPLERMRGDDGPVGQRRGTRGTERAGAEQVVEQASHLGIDLVGHELGVVLCESIFRRCAVIPARREEKNAGNEPAGQSSEH